jgi:hypothetical protein
VSDNFVANPGSGGSTFASDDIGGIQYPRLKVSVGPDSVAQDNWSSARLTSAASTNATVVKASAGALSWIYAVNLNAAVRYLNLYDKATTPAPATDNALLIAKLPIPASATGAGFMLPIPGGAAFPNGISFALVTGASDTDATAVAANEIFLWLGFA